MRRFLLPLALLAATALGAPAQAATGTLHFRCGGGVVNGVPAIEAMENEYIIQAYKNSGGCWFHIGHHTYDIGREVALHRVNGSMFSVEQHFSPPIEMTSDDWAVIIETSRDGLAWTEVARPRYGILVGVRQSISFDFDAGGAVARYVRIRQPLSAAQGLSGYLDSSNFDAAITEVTQPAAPARPLTLSCAEDIMERFWAAHPCWFGGINRYDSPSVFHTYPVHATGVTQIDGSVVVLPWRSDDFQSGGSRTAVGGVVQTSVDGIRWTTAGSFSGTYGAPIAFSVPVSGVDATYVRLAAEYHSRASTHPALKHVRGFLVDSSLTLTVA